MRAMMKAVTVKQRLVRRCVEQTVNRHEGGGGECSTFGRGWIGLIVRSCVAKARYIRICPEMHANEIHELYDRHHKVSPNLNSY